MADAVTVRELRQNLSVYLRRVERGETLSVTRRGEAVAVLAPRRERLSAVDRLVADHGAIRPTRRLDDLPSPTRSRPGERPLSEVLESQREERLR